MDLDVFRSLCGNKTKTDQDVLLCIMDAKRVDGAFSADVKDEIRTILIASHRDDLARKVCKYFARYQSQQH